MKKIILGLFFSIVFATAGTMTDSRDGRTYRTAKINDQVWMAENLNYLTNGSMCYDNKNANCKKYGRLYTWEEAKNACPDGWHLPSYVEFWRLITNVEKETAKNANLRSKEWKNGADVKGFNALPAGVGERGFIEFVEKYVYSDEGSLAFFWTSSKDGIERTKRRAFLIGDDHAFLLSSEEKNVLSVRCLKNPNDDELDESPDNGVSNKNGGIMKDYRDGKVYKIVKAGNQVWMAENLSYKSRQTSCCGNSEYGCQTFGRLYSWKDANLACPAGWHLPSKEEFENLIDVTGKSSENLISCMGWEKACDKNSTIGFSAFPVYGGVNMNEWKTQKSSCVVGGASYFWSSTKKENGRDAYILELEPFSVAVLAQEIHHNENPVRCVKDDTNTLLNIYGPSKNEIGTGKDKNWENEVCSQPELRDNRDSKRYKTMKIGTMAWMAENLKYDDPESACYDNDPMNCEKYGRMYQWEVSRTICPEGWRLPSRQEYEDLIKYATLKAKDVKKSVLILKSKSEWNGTNELGFDAKPFGGHSGENDEFFGVGRYTAFWSVTPSLCDDESGGECEGPQYAYQMSLQDDKTMVSESEQSDYSYVRCVRAAFNGPCKSYHQEAVSRSSDDLPKKLSKEDVSKVVSKNMPRLLETQKNFSRRNHHLSGKIVFSVSIQPRGVVESCEIISSTTRDVVFDRKIKAEVKHWTFPKSREGIKVTIPLTFNEL